MQRVTIFVIPKHNHVPVILSCLVWIRAKLTLTQQPLPRMKPLKPAEPTHRVQLTPPQVAVLPPPLPSASSSLNGTTQALQLSQ
jgi:hypothetical protein